MSYEPVNIETNEEGISNYSANRCDVYTTDASGLASTRAALEDPSAHILLPEIISKEPLGGATRHGDDEWSDIGKWVVNALIVAEELGVTSANIGELCGAAGNNPSINRLCGTEGDMGSMLGLDAQWAVRAISVAGNYAEIFDANIGPDTPLALERGLNASWRDGGILYAAPIR
jgi:general L-amino acid transport system substrate-binding protein